MAIEDRRREWFSFGRVFSRGFESFRLAMAPALLITLLFIVGPQAVVLGLFGGMRSLPDFERLMSAGLIFGAAVGGILIWIFSVAAQTGLVFLAMSAQQRKTMSFGESMLVGLRTFLPVLGMSILIALGTGLGLILLVVPGVMLMVLWSVAVPARLHDGPGVFAALEESSSLTKGVRWQVFAILLLTGIALWVVQMLGSIPGAWMQSEYARYVTAVVQPLLVGITTLVSSFGSASLFHELKWGGRDANEEATAEMFE